MSRSRLLQEPPQPRQEQDVTSQACPYATPPPSPRLSPTSPATEYKYFGVLQPITKDSKAKGMYYLRPGHLGDGFENPTDSLLETHDNLADTVRRYCEIFLSTAKRCTQETVRIVARSDYDMQIEDDQLPCPNGTLLNDHLEPLENGKVHTLRHGDRIEFGPQFPYGPDEVLKFVWLQCEKGGWRPLDYTQEEIDYRSYAHLLSPIHTGPPPWLDGVFTDDHQ